MNKLFKRINQQLEQQYPFVIFAKPESMTITGYFQKDGERYTFDDRKKNGFVFHPFDASRPYYAIPKEKAEIVEVDFDGVYASPHPVEIHDNPNEQEAYEVLVQKALDWIAKKKTMKIVTSRRHVEKIDDLDLPRLVNALFSLYPTAYRYLWYHPNTGVWCGATPELLLQSDGECFKTMALAGTQYPDAVGRVSWSDKEREEQQLVVDDIVDKLQKVLSVIKISKTHNHLAGTIMHLRTDISGCVKKGKNTLLTIAEAMHPTPAVCGTPMSKARKFIDLYEGYDREFYTGYLGELHENEEGSNLYVNLRCMKIESGLASIFVGGGITHASDPTLEWKETENKLQTMLQVLQPLL